MTTPLALVFYEAPLPGSKLVNRLQDLNYRVVVHSQAASLVQQAKESKPFLMIVDLAGTADVSAAIGDLRKDPETAHIAVLAYAKDAQEERRSAAHAAGATMVASDTAVLTYLPQLIQQMLELES